MDPVTTTLGSILLVAVHLLLVAAFSRHLSGSSETGGPDATRRTDAGDPETETVTCPDCGAENERGYKYCANCVGELPGAVSRTSSSGVPSREGIL